MSRNEGPHLAWNVKDTFRAYVEQAGGVIDVAEPAVARDNTFVFPYVGVQSEPDGAIHRFSGAIRFTAHGGTMNLLVQDPWIHIDSDGQWLSVAGTEATRTAGGRLVLANLAGARPRQELVAALTSEGAVAFDFRYPSGAELAPISYVLPNS
ncbi:HtaA domain-containing protein [Lacisediminihabitans sp. FW035]